MHYLASPYSHPDPLVRKTRYLLAQQAVVGLWRQGLNVWSPIVHNHEAAERFAIPKDAKFWRAYNFDFIRRCDGVIVLAITGWGESKGIAMELAIARELALPVSFVNETGEALAEGAEQGYNIFTDSCQARGPFFGGNQP